jgi:hypothetical protein
MEFPRPKQPTEDSLRHATRRKYNVQQEESNLDAFLQERGIVAPCTKRQRLGTVAEGPARARANASSLVDVSAAMEGMSNASELGAWPNESNSISVSNIIILRSFPNRKLNGAGPFANQRGR